MRLWKADQFLSVVVAFEASWIIAAILSYTFSTPPNIWLVAVVIMAVRFRRLMVQLRADLFYE